MDAINTVEDWIIAHAVNPGTGGEWRHVYAGTGPYTARIDSCCRTDVELNNPGSNYEVSSIIDLSMANASPVSAIAPIVACPQGPCIFQVPAADTDADNLAFRLSTPVEAGSAGFQQPGNGTVDPLTISPLGLVAWDSGDFAIGLYSNSITLDESRLGAPPHGKVMLDYLINTDEFLGNAPVVDVPPTPENAENIDVNAVMGETLNVTVQCSDPDTGDIVTLGHLGLPGTATMTPSIAIGNPAIAQINWAPEITQVAAISLSCTDNNGNRALPHAFTVNVEGLVIPPGPDRDDDLFCDDMTINQLISSGLYNVIDNDLRPSAVLVGTADRDLILGGGLGDIMYGFGGDDCIIGGVGDANVYPGSIVTVSDNGTPQMSDSLIFLITVTVAVLDTDTDTIPDISDNCTLIPNPDQRDTNMDGFGNSCDPDLDNDGITNFGDLSLFRDAFLTADGDADFNGDGAVNFLDLSIFSGMFLSPPGPAGAL